MKHIIPVMLLLLTGCSCPIPPQSTTPLGQNKCPGNEKPSKFGAMQAIASAEYALRLQDRFDKRNRPFSAQQKGNLWIVTGTIAPSGAPEVHVDKDSKMVVEIFYRFMQEQQIPPAEAILTPDTATALARAYRPNLQGELHAALQGEEWSITDKQNITQLTLSKKHGGVINSANALIDTPEKALLVGKLFLSSILGEESTLHRHLAVGRRGNTWIIEGSLPSYPSGIKGGIPHLELAREDGRVISITEGR